MLSSTRTRLTSSVTTRYAPLSINSPAQGPISLHHASAKLKLNKRDFFFFLSASHSSCRNSARFGTCLVLHEVVSLPICHPADRVGSAGEVHARFGSGRASQPASSVGDSRSLSKRCLSATCGSKCLISISDRPRVLGRLPRSGPIRTADSPFQVPKKGKRGGKRRAKEEKKSGLHAVRRATVIHHRLGGCSCATPDTRPLSWVLSAS